MNEIGATKVYLVTEDSSIKERFYKEFGERLILSLQHTIDYRGGYLGGTLGNRDNAKDGAAYLAAVYNLSRCKHLVAGKCGGTIAAVLFADKEQVRHLFHLGVYQ